MAHADRVGDGNVQCLRIKVTDVGRAVRYTGEDGESGIQDALIEWAQSCTRAKGCVGRRKSFTATLASRTPPLGTGGDILATPSPRLVPATGAPAFGYGALRSVLEPGSVLDRAGG
jgi:hypothetical protein